MEKKALLLDRAAVIEIVSAFRVYKQASSEMASMRNDERDGYSTFRQTILDYELI